MAKNPGLKLWKYSGIFLVATGIIHSIVGIAIGKDYLWGIITEGLFNTVQDDDFSRGLSFWFLVCGIAFIILGHLLHYYINKEQQPAPDLLGYWLLGLGIIGCIIMPVSGFWLFFPQALIILANNKRRRIYQRETSCSINYLL